VAEELPKVRSTLGEAAWQVGKYAEGAALFEQITLGDYVEFLTLPAYEQIQ
jgi:malate synthase